MRKLILFLWCCLAAFTAIFAQPIEEDLPQITGCIALTNARVVTMAGKEPSVQNVIMRDGLITAIGSQAKIPADAYKIAADSFYVYPAFIDAFSYIGIKEPEQQGRGQRPPGDERPEIDEEGNASLEASGITPFNHVRATFDPKEKSISDWRAQGFAVAHVVPRGRMIPGQGAIAVLSGKTTDQILWKEDVSYFGQWTGAGNSYPSTVIGVMAKWRELYHNASQDVNHLATYNENAMVSRPPYNQAHDALIPLVKKERPLYFKAVGVKDISRALAMQKDLGMKMIIADAKEAWYFKDQFKTNGIPLVLSLDLPEDKDEAKEKDGRAEKAPADAKAMADKEGAEKVDSAQVAKKDSVAKDPEKEAFIKRRAESLKAHQEQAGVLSKEGIAFSFGTMSGKTNEFSKTMQTMIENGLDKNSALNALTMQPAKLLGIDKYCGSLEAGKMANLIVSNKPLFEKEAAIRYMIVEGNLYEYEIKEKKKQSPTKESHGPASVLAGTWSYSIETPEQKREGTFEFSQVNGEWKGTITSSEITSGNSTLKDIVLDGQKVAFSYDLDMGGQALEIEFDLTINGDSLEGNVSVGEFGSFPVTGTRTSTPH